MASGAIARVRVAGDVRGGSGPQSGVIQTVGGNVNTNAGFPLGPVTIGGDLRGGTADYSGYLYATGSVLGVTVGGSVVGAAGRRGGSVVAGGGNLGPVKITGDVRGGSGPESAALEARSARRDRGASLSLARVPTGVTQHGPRIGPARGVAGGRPPVNGASRTLPGSHGGRSGPGVLFGPAAMGPVTIGGALDGTANTGDHFGFLAGRFVSVSIAGQPLALKLGGFNDDLALGSFGDFRLAELRPLA